MKVMMDLDALKAAAERQDSGPNAFVSRAFLRDIARIVAGEAEVVLVDRANATAQMVAA